MVKIINPKLVPKGYAEITIYPFVFFRSKERVTERLINHESIHLKQQKEMLVLFFYIAYGINYLINIFRYDTKKEAYRNIVFEREAYANEKDLNYLENRKLFSWVNYIKNP